QFVSPELATLVAEPPRTGEWLYEVKHDGYRMLARLAKRDARLFTRSGKDWTDRLPHLARELKRLKLEDSWLDGEIVVLRPDGRSSFQALQNAFDAGADSRIVYYVFDAPYLKCIDQTRLPLAERKAALAAKLKARKRADAPLVDRPREKGITWVKRQLVGQIAFAERSDDGILRQGSCLGLREDSAAKSVVDERAQKPPESQSGAKTQSQGNV